MKYARATNKPTDAYLRCRAVLAGLDTYGQRKVIRLLLVDFVILLRELTSDVLSRPHP